MNLSPIQRKLRSINRRYREVGMVAKALKSPRHPVLVHMIATRRCNLACTYCNEFDDFSQPVPTNEMLHRIDLLAALGTAAITISGGEPLLHPQMDEIIQRIRSHGILTGLITNGYLLTVERIKRFNKAGLDQLQISIDNVVPDDVSKKSLKVLDKKLQWLAEHAEFAVNINSVLGSSIGNPQDALNIARRALALGLKSTVGIIHDHSGQLLPLTEEQQKVHEEILALNKPVYTEALYNQFQKNLNRGLPNDWHCTAGSRYLYICEDGLVHYCSQQRGHPGIPLEQYTQENLQREYKTVKPCAPYCTISCVQRVAMVDYLREKPLEAVQRFFPAESEHSPLGDRPMLVNVLCWLLLPSKPGEKKLLQKMALRLLRVK